MQVKTINLCDPYFNFLSNFLRLPFTFDYASSGITVCSTKVDLIIIMLNRMQQMKLVCC